MKMHKLAYHHHHLLARLAGTPFALLLLTISLQPQPCSAIDLSTLPVGEPVVQTGDLPLEYPNFNLQLKTRLLDYTYRIEVTDEDSEASEDDGHLHLDCISPASAADDTFSLTELALNSSSSCYPLNESELRSAGAISRLKSELEATFHRRRPEVSISGGNLQALELYQRQTLRWKAPGSVFSLDETVRAAQFEREHFFAANEEGKSGSEGVLYTCLAAPSLSLFEREVPEVGFLSPSDGRCKTASGLWRLPSDTQNQAEKLNNSRLLVVTAQRRPYRLLTRLDDSSTHDYTWVEVVAATNETSNLTAQKWTPPAKAVQVDINEDSVTSLPPIYLARFRQTTAANSSSSSLVIVGLPRRSLLSPLVATGKLELLVYQKRVPFSLFKVALRLDGAYHPVNSLAKFWVNTLWCQQRLHRNAPLPVLGRGKLELLTVKETPEVPFQVMLRLAGHSHPLNSRAKVWQDYLQCSLFNSSASATADKIDERLLLSWRSEQLAAPKLNLHEEASVTQFSANEELVLQHKVTTWKIYQRLYSDFSSGNFYFWGEGFNGSLFTYNRPFYALFKLDSEERSNYASGFRPICRANEGNSWVPGFLNMRTGRCLASGLNGTVISSLDYKVLYHFYQRPQADRQQWVPYQRNLTAISVRGAIYADFGFFGKRPRVLIARLKVLITGESSGQNGTHRMLYGSLAAGQNVFRYVEEGSTEEGHVTHAIEGAEEKGAQILVISD